MHYCGPAGLTESDDMENWNYCYPASMGTIAQRLPYNFEMGLGHGQTDEQWPEVTVNYQISEEPARFRGWLEFEVTANPRDGGWLCIRFVEYPEDPARVGEEDMVFCSDVLSVV